jgi:hypothetical protein
LPPDTVGSSLAVLTADNDGGRGPSPGTAKSIRRAYTRRPVVSPFPNWAVDLPAATRVAVAHTWNARGTCFCASQLVYRKDIASYFTGRTDCVSRRRGGGGKPSTIRPGGTEPPGGAWSRRLAAGRDSAPGGRVGPEARRCERGRTSALVAAQVAVSPTNAPGSGYPTGLGLLGQRLEFIDVFGCPKVSCPPTAADCRDSRHCILRFSRAHARPRPRAMQTVATVRDSRPVKCLPRIAPLPWLLMIEPISAQAPRRTGAWCHGGE